MAALSLPRTAAARGLLRRSYGTVQSTIIPPAASSPTPPLANSILQDAITATGPRMNWTREEIQKIYNTPLNQLTYASATVHRRFHDPAAIQMCTLMNIKTGGCSEDCSYCAQSSRYSTGLKATKLSPVDSVLEAARVAKENGSTRFCMGAAWRDMRGRKTNLKNIKAMVSGVRSMGMEVCVTLGMIDGDQAKELKDAGLTAYNHNLDTSREFYPSVISTRTYDERLQTLGHVRDAGINVCSGGILGLGEGDADRVGLLHTVATLPSHPESFPVNALVPIKGTPLGDRKMISFDKILRTVATARIVLPISIVRLAAGRISMSEEQQVTCFQAGANAIFTGEKMLTTDCSGWEEDKKIFDKWGYYPMPPFKRGEYRGRVTAETATPPPPEPAQTRSQSETTA
ncbi:biotin synthase [Ophidiomyces ophidiicola]|uniref:biotin synthase n=1 Tax=Ophidiomyces ophidiicola TaxID=1387563 RepID=UPI0020C24B8C|nr:biotin synthase [Ophidiomyces ophidiicola]KAI1939662.1 biotin synthase [Ophidiomyces ophidiicola]KAI2047348.1 biotin synthase [Ophidiomyces ophidiicola]KAI2083800.1 biotin synthase [Ophidiomyces ophidiicola]